MTGCNSSKGATPSEEITSVEADSGNALADSIQTILDDKEYYPDITSIEVTSDYTLFTITLESDVMNTYESMLVMSFYTAGNEQQIAAGVSPEDAKTTVRYYIYPQRRRMQELHAPLCRNNYRITFTGTVHTRLPALL